MPKRLAPTPGVRTSVTRPVVLDVARQLLEITRLPADTPVQYPDSDEPMYQPGSTMDLANDTVNFGAGTKLYLTVEETIADGALLATAVRQEETNWIYQDPEVFAFMRPVYSPTMVTINIQYRASDRDSAEMWRNDIKRRLSETVDVFVHNASYHYLIPEDHVEIIREIHRLREARAPYNQTWEEYAAEKFSNKLRLVSNQAGAQQSWAVAETQSRVQGYFDFAEGPEEGSKQSGNSSWTISVSYKFRFDKPIETYLEYPLVVHNQLIDKKYRPTAKPYDETQEQQRPAISIDSMRAFEVDYRIDWKGRTGVCLPVYDEFLPSSSSILPNTARIVTALCTVDQQNPRNLLDLTSLGRYNFTPAVLQFMRAEYQYLAKPQLSILNVCVYRGQYLMEQGSYSVNEDLMVVLAEDPDERKTYHVRVSIYERPRLLPPAAKDRMRNNCAVAREFLKALNPQIENTGLLPTCMVGNYMPQTPFNAALEYLDKRFDARYTGEVYQWNTVMQLIIGARRKEN